MFSAMVSRLISLLWLSVRVILFFFNDTATTEIYTLSLHDALPISGLVRSTIRALSRRTVELRSSGRWFSRDRKSTRLNSSHSQISYAVFCLKKKKNLSALDHRDFLMRWLRVSVIVLALRMCLLLVR